MLWVGGHILLVGMNDLGFTPIYDFVHGLEVPAAAAGGAFVGWLVNTLFSALLGLIIGGIAVAIMSVLPFGKHGEDHDEEVSQQEAAAALKKGVAEKHGLVPPAEPGGSTAVR